MSVFSFNNDEKVGIFIDGPNLFQTMKALNFDVDYKKLLEYMEYQCNLIRASYYTATYEDDSGENVLRPLLDWLSYNGYRTVTKPSKEFVDDMGRRKLKSNMEVEITVDMYEAVQHLDHVVLFSGNGDLSPAVNAVQRLGKKVTVVSSLEVQIVSDDLRRQANKFVELNDLVEYIGKTREERKVVVEYTRKRAR